MSTDLTIQPEKLTPSEVRAKILGIMKSKNYDPFLELIELALEHSEVEVNGRIMKAYTCDVDQRITIAKEIASFIAPKLKGIEIRAEVDAEFTFKVQQFGESKQADKELARPGEPARQMLVDAETRQRVKDFTAQALERPLQIVTEDIVAEEQESRDA